MSGRSMSFTRRGSGQGEGSFTGRSHCAASARSNRVFEWITASFEPLGISDITMWTELAGHQESELDLFDGVYIGGGNTYSLLAELRESGFDRYLTSFARQGKAVYGGSAGAAVLGRDIRTVDPMDHNHVGITDMSGLDLAGGHAVWVHYTSADDSLVHSFVERYKLPVLALSERAGLVIGNDGIRSGGFEPVWRFDRNERVVV